MLNRFLFGAVLGCVILMPLGGWAAKPVYKHDCRVEKGGRYVCERGPLAGKTFASRKAMMEAVSAGSPSDVGRSPAERPSAGKSGKGKSHKKN